MMQTQYAPNMKPGKASVNVTLNSVPSTYAAQYFGEHKSLMWKIRMYNIMHEWLA
jgi:hypothetical protein